MGFDTSGGGGEAGGGGTIFDDPQFMQSLQGVLQQQPQGGGGYEQDPWAGGGGAASQEQMYRRPRRKYMGGGGEADFGDPRRGQGMGGGGVVSAPDGTVYGGGATSPFEVGPSSGAPNTLHAAMQQPGGGGYGRFPGMGGSGGGGDDPNDPNSYQYMRSHPPAFSMDIGPGSANESQQRAWSQKLEQARLRGGGGGGNGGILGGGGNGPGGGMLGRGDLRGGGGGRRPLGPESRGGWYGGYGNQGGGGQQQWYRPQQQGTSRPPTENPGAAYDAGPGRAEARDEAAAQPQAPPRWQMPQGGAYGQPQPQRRRRFYGNSGAIQNPGATTMPVRQWTPSPADNAAVGGTGGYQI